jgi:plasmid stability protein
MATLYVENVPDEIYKALKRQARVHRRSIAAEIISLLEEHIPTDQELKRRRRAFEGLARLRAMEPLSPGPFPSAEEMIREDRER